jgi:glycosyltransferase involved in cell wall biosynthesis
MNGDEAAPRRRVVFICQAVDEDDPVLPTTVRWIESLARKPGIDQIKVLALRSGRYDLPANVEVERFGRSNRLATSAAFYRAIVSSLRDRPDLFFIYQGGHYPLLLMPLKLLRGIPIVHWKAHAYVSRSMSFYARWCDDLILTSARAAFPMDLAKVRVVGQGIDTERFRIEERPLLGDLIAVGRITPIKGIAEMVRAVAHANRSYGTEYSFNIYGPTLPGNEEYAAGVKDLIERLGATGGVTLHGPVRQDRLPSLLSAHRASLNFSRGAIDKTSVEAMACGLPVVSNNDAIIEVLPPDLQPVLVTDKQSTESQASTIHQLLQRPEAEIAELGKRVRALVVADHSIERLFDRILEEIETLLRHRRFRQRFSLGRNRAASTGA